MANPKMKSESYTNYGGINTKQSPYLTSITEFLDLINFDFQLAGSLSERWGSTQYMSQGFSNPISALFEFSRLDGSSFVIVGTTGAMWSGATTGQSQGQSLTSMNATLVLVPAISVITYFKPISVGSVQEAFFGAAYPGIAQFSNSNNLIAPFGLGAGQTLYINPQLQKDNNLSFQVLDNYMFGADGNKFVKFDGTTMTPVGLIPAIRSGNLNVGGGSLPGASVYASNLSASLALDDVVGFANIGYYGLYASYVNNRGFEGPLWPIGLIAQATPATMSAIGGTYFAARFPMYTPLCYGISAINLYTYWQAATLSMGSTFFFNGLNPVFANSFPASGSTITWIQAGTSILGQSFLQSNIGNFYQNNGYSPQGMTFVINTNFGATTALNPIEVDFVSYYPRYLEVYQNQLFSAGYSATPSTIWFSGVSEPEGYTPDSNFEVRTNDADYITCIKSYFTSFYIFKQNSFHVLSGDNPLNFFIQPVSLVYGCLNDRCAVVYDNLVAFLDRKGVVVFNGASPTMLSMKIQPIFDTMNYNVALQTACMVHDKLRNQLLVAIPINGATQNNVTLVYDYLVGAWTKQDGYNPTVFAAIQGRNNTKNVFYGTSTGLVNWFGSSFLSDNGAGFTTYFKTRFLHDPGESYQKQFRRLYLNTDAPNATMIFHVNFFQDFGASIVKSVTIVASQFQTRIDYGISAKSLAFEFSSFQTNQVLRLHGYTIESRIQRNV